MSFPLVSFRRHPGKECRGPELPGTLRGLNSPELAALSSETNPEIFYEGLLTFGDRQRQLNHLEEAAASYAAVVAGSETREELRVRARGRLEEIQGGGAFGSRFETILRNVARESTDPTVLAAMTLGSLAFQTTRFAMSSRLLAAPSGFWTRGFAAQAIAGVTAYAAEAPVFAISGRVFRESLRGNDPGRGTTLWSEIGAAYLFLGTIKLSAYSIGTAWRHLAPTALARSEAATGLVRHTGIFGGILLNRRIESLWDPRPGQSRSFHWVDALGTLVQLSVSGRIASGILGPGYHAWENEMVRRSDHLLNFPPRGTWSLPIASRSFAFAESSENLPATRPMFMNTMDPKGARRAGARITAPTFRTTNLHMILLNLPHALNQEQPRLNYDGELWVEKHDAGVIADRLRQERPLPRDKTLELFLVQQSQRVIFFWEGDEVNYRTERVEVERLPLGKSLAEISDQAITLPRMAAVRSSTMRAGPAPVSGAKPVELLGIRYELEADRKIGEFYGQTFGANAKPFSNLEESNALRGRLLARIAHGISQMKLKEDDTQPSMRPIDIAIQIHWFLENAYRHLDFGTLRSFQERASAISMRHFDHVIALYNMRAEYEQKPTLPTLDEMPTELPGTYLLPRSPGLRHVILSRIFATVPDSERTATIPLMLSDPQKLGAVYAAALHPLMIQLSEDASQLEGMVPTEGLAQLLDPVREYQSSEAKNLQETILRTAREIPEFNRIVVEGRGIFHRDFLRSLFFDSEPALKDVYPQFFSIAEKIPDGDRPTSRNLVMPTLGLIRHFTDRYSSRPPAKP